MADEEIKLKTPYRTSAKQWKTFILALADGKTVTAAAKEARIGRASCYARYDRDPGFAKRWDAALEKGVDKLEDEAFRRAHDGVDEGVYYKGERVDTVRKYSDVLLIFLLKANRPEKYRENVKVLPIPEGTLAGDEKKQYEQIVANVMERAKVTREQAIASVISYKPEAKQFLIDETERPAA